MFQYDTTRVISLSSRKDRRREIAGEMARFRSAPDFFDAIRPADPGPFMSTGAHGCYLSHLRVLREATGSVLILEDDCTFTPDALEYRAPDCDIFYGGFQSDDPENGWIIGAHCMGFSAKAARLAADYLAGLYERRLGPDPRAASEEPNFNPDVLPPVDGAYVWFRRAHPELKTVFAQIARQRPSRSDIMPGRYDRITALRPFVGMARKMRYAVTAQRA